MRDEWQMVVSDLRKRGELKLVHGDDRGLVSTQFIPDQLCAKAADLIERLAADPSPPVSVEQAGKATAAMVGAAMVAYEASPWLRFGAMQDAINAALQLSVSPVQETKEEAR